MYVVSQSVYNSTQYLTERFLYFFHIWLLFWGKLRNGKTAFCYTPLAVVTDKVVWNSNPAYGRIYCLPVAQNVHMMKCVQPSLQSLPAVHQRRSVYDTQFSFHYETTRILAPAISPTDNLAILLTTLSASKLRRPNNTTADTSQFVISTSAR